MQNVLKRPPTSEEANALAFWSAKQLSLYSYGPPAGIAAGCYRAYMTMSTFQFPFFKPNPETFTPTVFPPGMPLLGGRAAIIAWHTMRFAAYGVVGNFVSQVLFGSYSVSVATVGEMGDPRLKNYIEAVRKISKERFGGPNGAGGVQNQHGGPPGQQLPGGTQRNWPPTRPAPYDDASPTAGKYGDVEEAANYSYGDAPAPDSGNSYQNTTGASQPQMPPQPRRQWPARPPVPSPTAQSQSPNDNSQPFDFFDEDSPTGGRGSIDTPPLQQQQRTRPSISPSGESSWAKIRAGALNQAPGSTTASTIGDGSGRESQQEFDARVERERRGEDFGGGGDQKRW